MERIGLIWDVVWSLLDRTWISSNYWMNQWRREESGRKTMFLAWAIRWTVRCFTLRPAKGVEINGVWVWRRVGNVDKIWTLLPLEDPRGFVPNAHGHLGPVLRRKLEIENSDLIFIWIQMAIEVLRKGKMSKGKWISHERSCKRLKEHRCSSGSGYHMWCDENYLRALMASKGLTKRDLYFVKLDWTQKSDL